MITLAHEKKQFINYSKEELVAAGVPNSVITIAENELVLEQRKAAYKIKSDPLYMEWQFDQTAVSEKIWRDKVTEIKLRYPLITTS